MEKKIVSVGTRMCFVVHQWVFALKCVNALVEDYPPSNQTHSQLHQWAERYCFLHPPRPANGPGLLGASDIFGDLRTGTTGQ